MVVAQPGGAAMIRILLIGWAGCVGKGTDTGASRSSDGNRVPSGPLQRVAVSETSTGKVVITDGNGGNVFILFTFEGGGRRFVYKLWVSFWCV